LSRANTLTELEDSLRYVNTQFSRLDGVGAVFLFELSSLFENGNSVDAIKKTSLKYDFHLNLVTSMVLEKPGFDKIDLKGLEIQKVETMEQLIEVINFDRPDDCTDWGPILDFWKTMYSYIGYFDGKVVTMATAIVHHGKVFLSTVGTKPDYRNRGYGTAISKYALQSAIEASGSTISLLHASKMGKSVYEKIGFKEIGIAAYSAYKPAQEV
jgi:ribosomal protein S18 acetylase RimI-like enzyme